MHSARSLPRSSCCFSRRGRRRESGAQRAESRKQRAAHTRQRPLRLDSGHHEHRPDSRRPTLHSKLSHPLIPSSNLSPSSSNSRLLALSPFFSPDRPLRRPADGCISRTRQAIRPFIQASCFLSRIVRSCPSTLSFRAGIVLYRHLLLAVSQYILNPLHLPPHHPPLIRIPLYFHL